MTDSHTSRRLLTMLACAAALVAAGCGADEEEPEPKGKPIPAAQVQELQVRLDEIGRRFDFGDGACADIQDDSEPAVEQILRSIPDTVSADVRSALNESFDRLFSMSASDCDEEKGQDTNTTETTPPETTTTETVTVPTTPTETTPTETTPTQPTTPTTPTEQTPPPDEGVEGGDQQGGGFSAEEQE